MSVINEDRSVCLNEGLEADLQEPDTRAESPSMPHVTKAQWEPEDHVAEFSRILQGVKAEHVERQLVHYVENKIEPAGWRAVWTIPKNLSNSPFTLKEETCVYVDVVDVSQEKLMADVYVLRPVIGDISKEDFNVLEEGKNKMVQVPLMELSVLAGQENEALDMVSTAEVISQLKFFYEHIWQPWDLEEENVCYDKSLITSRIKLYQDIEGGNIPSSVGVSLKAIIREASIALKKIHHIESKNEDKGADFEMNQKDVAQLFKLHKQMEKLKSQFDMLKNPVLREISIFPSHDEETSVKGPHAKVKVVASALTTLQMMKHMAMLPHLATTLSQVSDNDLWQTCTTLQNAINAAHEGDVIILLPGQHVIYQLGYLFAKCGTLIGVGEGVVVEGSSENGDVLMDITGNFTIQNITLQPAPNQIGIVQHGGLTTIEKVKLKGGKWGCLGLGNAEFCMSQVCVQTCSGGGMDFRDGAVANISDSSISSCKIGIQVEEGAKVSLTKTKIEGNRKYGVLKVLSELSDSSRYQDISTDELLACTLQNGAGNTVEHNGKDDVAVISGSPSSSRSQGSNSTDSSPTSIDSQEIFTNSTDSY